MTDAKSVAGEISQVDEAILQFLPGIGGLLGIIPGAQVGVPIVAGVTVLLKALDGAAKVVAAGKPGASPQEIVEEVVNHLTPGKVNSPLLGELTVLDTSATN